MATLRRSSAKLRSLGSGHADLILAISQWKELRSATKSLMAAQESTSNDLLKWSSKEVCMLGGVKSVCKDPSFAQSLVIFAN